MIYLIVGLLVFVALPIFIGNAIKQANSRKVYVRDTKVDF